MKSDAFYQHVQEQLRNAELLHKKKKQDEVKHLVLGIPDWTTRLKSDELYRHVQ